MLFLKNQFSLLDAAEPWQLGFQDPATPVMEGIINFHHDLMFFLIVVTVFVCWMLYRAIVLFDEKKNKQAATFVHGSTIEIIWTTIPALILLTVAVPSFALLYSMDEVIDPIIGNRIALCQSSSECSSECSSQLSDYNKHLDFESSSCASNSEDSDYCSKTSSMRDSKIVRKLPLYYNEEDLYRMPKKLQNVYNIFENKIFFKDWEQGLLRYENEDQTKMINFLKKSLKCCDNSNLTAENLKEHNLNQMQLEAKKRYLLPPFQNYSDTCNTIESIIPEEFEQPKKKIKNF